CRFSSGFLTSAISRLAQQIRRGEEVSLSQTQSLARVGETQGHKECVTWLPSVVSNERDGEGQQKQKTAPSWQRVLRRGMAAIREDLMGREHPCGYGSLTINWDCSRSRLPCPYPLI